MLQARTVYLIVIAIGSAFLAGFGTAAVMFRPVMEGWRRKYYHEKRAHKGDIWFMGEALRYLKEGGADDFKEFCEMLRREISLLAKDRSIGRGANTVHRARMASLFETILTWIGERYPQEGSEGEAHEQSTVVA